MTFTILSLTGAYALVAALLAYVVLLSRLHWVFKAIATVATIALIPLTFNGVGELRGLPTDGPIPFSFRMLWAQVVEPAPLQSEKGHVFLWLQTLDADNFPVGQPRAYQLPYSDDLKIKVSEAMGAIAQGEQIQGTIDTKKALPEETAEALAEDVEAAAVNGNPAAGGSGTVGERIFQFDAGMLTFAVEAAPVTPEKPR
ncbi:MAG: hypothetical protein ABL879_11840 [Devosia sp.]